MGFGSLRARRNGHGDAVPATRRPSIRPCSVKRRIIPRGLRCSRARCDAVAQMARRAAMRLEVLRQGFPWSRWTTGCGREFAPTVGRTRCLHCAAVRSRTRRAFRFVTARVVHRHRFLAGVSTVSAVNERRRRVHLHQRVLERDVEKYSDEIAPATRDPRAASTESTLSEDSPMPPASILCSLRSLLGTSVGDVLDRQIFGRQIGQLSCFKRKSMHLGHRDVAPAFACAL